MSDNTLERRPQGQNAQNASATETGNRETALSPAERAEREIAKLDEDMDAILDNKPNRAALVNRPGQALQPPQGRSITPSVAPPIPASHFSHLVLNCVVPGSGTLLHGQTGKGMAQLGLLVGAVPVLIFVKFWLALLMVVVAYVWSISTGVGFLNTSASEKSWK